jgi:hypothetical protein
MLLQVNENVTSSELFSTFLKEVYRFKGWFIQNNTCLSLCSPDFKHFSLLNAKKKCNYFDFKDFCRDILRAYILDHRYPMKRMSLKSAVRRSLSSTKISV